MGKRLKDFSKTELLAQMNIQKDFCELSEFTTEIEQNYYTIREISNDLEKLVDSVMIKKNMNIYQVLNFVGGVWEIYYFSKENIYILID